VSWNESRAVTVVESKLKLVKKAIKIRRAVGTEPLWVLYLLPGSCTLDEIAVNLKANWNE